MLYNNGKQHKKIFLNGKQIRTVYKDGVCIYPGVFEPIAIMAKPISLAGTRTITAVLRSNVPPTDIDNAIDVSGSVSGEDYTGKSITIDSIYPIYVWISNSIMYWYSIADDIKIAGLGANNKDFNSCTNLLDISGLYDWDVGWLYSTFRRISDQQHRNNLSLLFLECSNLTDISSLANWGISKMSSARYMFYGCNAITSLSPIQQWDISSLTDMYGMFGYTGILSVPNIDWNSAPTADKGGLFYYCYNLTNIDNILDLDASSCSIDAIFEYCTSLEYALNLTWILNKGQLSKIFNRCSSLKVCDLSLCTAPNGLAIPVEFFSFCSNLHTCDIGNIFETTGYSNRLGIFYNCNALTTVIIRNIDQMVVRYPSSDGLQNVSNNHGTIYVPQVQLNNYLSDADWSALITSGAQILPLEGSMYEQPSSVSALYP